MARIGVVLALALAAQVTGSFEPAHLKEGGALPGVPGYAVGGGEVWLELGVSASGTVDEVVTLRETPPYADALRASVSHWSFEPAQEEGTPVASRVLVVGSFRPPTFMGPALGEPPRDVGAASGEVAVPTQSFTPAYPANAYGDGTVLVEAVVGSDGRVGEVWALGGPEPFAGATVAAVRDWQFRPASRKGARVEAIVCVVAGFRTPVVGPPPLPPKPRR